MGSRVGGLGNTAGLPADKALAGVPRLLDDLQRLSEDTDSADIIFILGREEERVFAHRVILMARYLYYMNKKYLFKYIYYPIGYKSVLILLKNILHFFITKAELTDNNI